MTTAEQPPYQRKGSPQVLTRGDYGGQAGYFIAHHRPNLKRHREEFRDHEGGHYYAISKEEFMTDARTWLNASGAWGKPEKKDGNPVAEEFRPSAKDVSEIVEALKAMAFLADRVTAPCWLRERPDAPPADELLAFPTGIFDLRNGNFYAPTPRLYTHFAAGFDYDHKAPTPGQWIKFLDEVFKGEQDQIGLLQEIFGYCLTSDTRHQKIFNLVGDKRSGKGTITRILKALCAEGTVVEPTLSSLGEPFGKQQLIGKQIGIINDARVDRRSDGSAIAVVLLSSSGGDGHTVGRKYMSPWHGELPIRWFIISNEMLKFVDSSAALATRFITLVTRQSFLGKEDLLLGDRLKAELPGIMNWTLDGLIRLRQRGRFPETQTSVDARRHLTAMMSDIASFADERLVFESTAVTPKAEVFAARREWLREHGMADASDGAFSRALLAAMPGRIHATRTVIGGKQVQVYAGVRLAPGVVAQGGDDALPF